MRTKAYDNGRAVPNRRKILKILSIAISPIRPIRQVFSNILDRWKRCVTQTGQRKWRNRFGAWAQMKEREGDQWVFTRVFVPLLFPFVGWWGAARKQRAKNELRMHGSTSFLVLQWSSPGGVWYLPIGELHLNNSLGGKDECILKKMSIFCTFWLVIILKID